MTSPAVERSQTLSVKGPWPSAAKAGAQIERTAAPASPGAVLPCAGRGAAPPGRALGVRWPSQRGLLSQLLASAALLAAWCVLWGSFALAVIAPPWMLPAAGARAAEVRPQGGSPGSLPGVAGPGERRS